MYAPWPTGSRIIWGVGRECACRPIVEHARLGQSAARPVGPLLRRGRFRARVGMPAPFQFGCLR